MKKSDRSILLNGLDNAITALANIPKRIILHEIPARNGMQIDDIEKLLTRERTIIAALPHELGEIEYKIEPKYDTIKLAIMAAIRDERKTAICQEQDDVVFGGGKFVLLGINDTRCNAEECDCYQVAQRNNCIVIAVCAGKLLGGAVDYVDL